MLCCEAADALPAVFRAAGKNPVNPVDPVGHPLLKASIRQDLQDAVFSFPRMENLKSPAPAAQLGIASTGNPVGK
jgi:hypothetical protein